jgi:hypothetical protein
MRHELHALKPWSGLLGGFLCWYAAHDLGFYFSDFNCRHQWIVPSIHLLALAASVYFTWISFAVLRSEKPDVQGKRGFVSLVSTGAGAVFSLVILYQGVATLIFKGCER